MDIILVIVIFISGNCLSLALQQRSECADFKESFGGILYGILLPKLFWPTVRKNCSSDREKLLKFEAEGREFSKFLRSLENLFKQWKVRTIFGNRMLF